MMKPWVRIVAVRMAGSNLRKLGGRGSNCCDTPFYTENREDLLIQAKREDLGLSPKAAPSSRSLGNFFHHFVGKCDVPAEGRLYVR